MKIEIFKSKPQLGKKAAADGVRFIKKAIEEKGAANIVLATGTSQFDTLEALVSTPDIAWSKVHVFHLDEYIGLPASHPASFRKYIAERFEAHVKPLGSITYIKGDAHDPLGECKRLEKIISAHPIDVAFIGIGENGHLAFNDPPADLGIKEAFLVVELDDVCRKQQMGEGWYQTLGEVPHKAITMSVPQILKSACIICSVPEQRKAEAVQQAVQGKVSEELPASVLQQHKNCFLYLDEASASLLA